MKLFEFIPQKSTKKLALVTGLLIIGAAMIMVATMLVPDMPYKWAVQLLSILMLTMGIFITTRYIMKSYIYTVTEEDDGRDLTVTETQGRRAVTVCRIAMSSITQVCVVIRGDRPADTTVKNQIKSEKRKLYNYCVDLFSEKYVYIFSNEGGVDIAIVLTWDPSLEEWFENVKYTETTDI